MSNNLSLSDIKTFVTIVSLGNLTKAAERLGSSRAHVSRQLSQLEKDLGVQLLIRTTRTQKLTEEGKAFYRTCSNSLEEIDKIASDIVDYNSSMVGNINVSSLGGVFGEEYVAKALAEFSLLYPKINVVLSFDSRHVDLMNEEYDVVIRAGELVDSQLVARPLMMMEMGLFASPEYLNRYGLVNSPDELNKHRCITGPISKWKFYNSEGDTKEVCVDSVMNCNNSRVLRQYALDGVGIIRLPYIYIQQDVEEKRLLSAITGWKISSSPINLLYNKHSFQPERLRVFIQFICDWFSNL
ncbi:LysR substrate-binding domain-containing protein [Vibrio sp. Of7-15]|uniref:LysR family transcriptional regulator n=1 Tax=Vibrio sp. Of7-15 TaxID=2724879 RepID=UPI001EF2D210|nr:LysR family transcriptional regulator [Vibrio sp. Of7-15]MCG7497302.1 LysR substrate-binding domain-containing protein [Vibrio sp. Of7-15]